MKFVLAVVMLVLAIGAQASIIAHHAPAVSYVTSAVHPAGPWGGHGGAWGHAGAWGHSGHGHYGPAAVTVHSSDYWGHGHSGPSHYDHSGPSHWGIPGISLSQGPHLGHAAPLAHDYGHGHGHGHEGVYVAKTRGAIHTAPLAGHVNSATSINLAPAPGTH